MIRRPRVGYTVPMKHSDLAVQAFPVLHDLHCHSFLSSCCEDESCTAPAIFARAKALGYDTLCLTDHLWDPAVPGASDWYAPQTPEHVLSSRRYADVEGLRCLVGCETEFGCGGLALAPEHYDLFDFVVIPPNHMHFAGLVRPAGLTGADSMAALFTDRLDRISRLDVPMEKTGIAHLTCRLLYSEGTVAEVIRRMDEKRLREIFLRFADRGAGIELNAAAFRELEASPDEILLPYRVAKDCGCRFYCASDAHRMASLERVGTVLPRVAELLGLTEKDRYVIPGSPREG